MKVNRDGKKNKKNLQIKCTYVYTFDALIFAERCGGSFGRNQQKRELQKWNIKSLKLSLIYLVKFRLALFLLMGCIIHTSAQQPGQNVGSPSKVADVGVVFKTHFDLGFMDLPENVFKRYREEMMVIKLNNYYYTGKTFVIKTYNNSKATC